MSGYAEPLQDPLRPLTAADLETIFRKPAGWFGRDRVRKRLYAKGFPHPIERGLWSAQAVRIWLETAGSNPNHEPPRATGRRPGRRRRSSNGYAAL